MIYTFKELTSKYSSYTDVKGKIRREIQKGHLIQVVKGLYVTDASIKGQYLAEEIYGPSYLSFDYALLGYGLIADKDLQKTFTSATSNKHKSKKYDNYFGHFYYRDIPQLVYELGVFEKLEEGYKYRIASPEKAVCDKLYTCSPVKSMRELKRLLFEELGINRVLFYELDMNVMKKLSEMYHTKNNNLLVKLIERESRLINKECILRAPDGERESSATLLDILKHEKDHKVSNGIYHKLQIEMTYNSNHIEGSKLSQDQTRYIFETNTIGIETQSVNVDDIIEAVNHFRCIDLVIDSANYELTEEFIKTLHYTLKSGTSDSRKDWFAIGNYKRFPNEVGGKETTKPNKVSQAIEKLLKEYKKIEKVTIEDIIVFHYEFECIHPFQDGNGRIGRLIIIKECLKNDIVPFFIDEELKLFYYRGLKEWKHQKGYLIDTCLTGQDKFKKYLDYFKIPY